MTGANPYRALPAVDELVETLGDRLPRPLLLDIARVTLEQARRDIGEGREADVAALGDRLVRAVADSSDRVVTNATGVLLHTNLGRAPWSARAIERARDAAAGYSNVELDLATGERGRRGSYVTALLRSLTGGEDALVVNNNAAGVLLTLAALAAGKSVPVARGELIEIGGAYRLPEVMAASGARLVEVGTTNRTRRGDYETALQVHRCSAILKVHPSNYRVEGFTEEASVQDLAMIAADNGLPLIYDIGSGLLDAKASWLPPWLRDEPGARQAIDEGANLVTFSGDKLLGGPQAGILVGDASLIELVRSHPLARALRVDGVTLAALAATLEEHLEGPPEAIPFWRHALQSETDLTNRAAALAAVVGAAVETGNSRVGAGSAPGIAIPSPLVRIPRRHEIYERLLERDRPVLARRDSGDLVVDLRAVEPGDDAEVAEAISRCL